MNKEDFKMVCIVWLFILYLIFGVTCAYATFEVTKEAGFSGFLTGGTITALLLIPVWYIGYHVFYEKNKDFFHDFFN